MKRTAFESSMEKRQAVKNAEANGLIADSMEVRKELIRKVEEGIITLEQAQAELKKIKKSAKSSGKITRSQAFNDG